MGMTAPAKLDRIDLKILAELQVEGTIKSQKEPF